MTPNDGSHLVGVMSTYDPTASVLVNIRAAASEMAHVVVVDDTGGNNGALDAVPANVTVIHQPRNSGLAGTLNRGVSEALGAGADLILTLDDDTHLPSGYAAAMAVHLRTLQERGAPVLSAGPGRLNGRPADYLATHDFEGGLCSLFPSQSGLIFDSRAFEMFGPFRTEFFMDALELDFLARLHRAGFHNSLATSVDLRHEIGDPQRVTLLGRTITPTNHAPFRRYYMVRNTLTFIRENRSTNPAEAEAVRRAWAKDMARTLVLEPDRYRKARAMFLGWRAYRKRRFGRAPDGL